MAARQPGGQLDPAAPLPISCGMADRDDHRDKLTVYLDWPTSEALEGFWSADKRAGRVPRGMRKGQYLSWWLCETVKMRAEGKLPELPRTQAVSRKKR